MDVLSLNGAWMAQEAGANDGFPATVPGTIHTDLLAAGRIPDPFYRDHEKQLQWISEKNWLFHRRFDVPESLLNWPNIELVCEGLDTFATVMLNGEVVAQTDNQHRTWVFSLKDQLQSGTNLLEIRFDSVLPYIRKRNAERKLAEWKAPFEEGGRGYVRKMSSNFGWDWGPIFTTCGIWRNIAIRAYDDRLRDVYFRQYHHNQEVRLDVTAESARTDGNVLIRLLEDDRVVVSQAAERIQNLHELRFQVPNPKLWWPNGMGDQPLYTLEVTLRDAEGRTIDVWSKKIGLRTLKLRRENDEWGQRFYFEANGIPFFAKGANWIPGDALFTRFDQYEDILQSAQEAHMNMIRVWGGGLYEDERFYDVCDALGLCVWQDFAFACSNYPGRETAFQYNVWDEATDNIQRIRHRACLALWCGNNELELGLVGKIPTAWNGVWEDYDPLFTRLLKSASNLHDPQRDYWPCSPHNPLDRNTFNDPRAGDAHLWSVWHKQEPFEWYRTSYHRFVSEFGFQSFPEPKHVRTFTEPEDRKLDSNVMLVHQRSFVNKVSGNFTILHYAKSWFRPAPDFDATLWQSQLLQALAMQYAVEHWRRNQPRCMGALYWQLNDCWPVASWASLDDTGRWKALHYAAKRFFAPVLVSGVEDVKRQSVAVHLTNDGQAPLEGEIHWTLWLPDGARMATGVLPAEVGARSSRMMGTVELAEYARAHGSQRLILHLSMTSGDQILAQNTVTLDKPKDIPFEPANIELSTFITEEGVAATLTADKPTLWCWLTHETADFRADDNFVALMPGIPKTVLLKPTKGVAPQVLADGLDVLQLTDVG